jgi:hypothetical protein
LVCHGTIGFPLHCGSSFLNDLGWCWIPDLSSRLSKYLLFMQEKYSWFTSILEQLTSLRSVHSSHSVLSNSEQSSCEYLSSCVESFELPTWSCLELLILAEPYILHSPYMWVSDRFHIYSIQK